MDGNPLLDRWEEIDALFNAALDLPAAERAAFVRDATRGDEELLCAVLALLESSEQTEGFLEQPHLLLQEGLSWDEPEAAAIEGQRVGPYRLLEEIGRGGTGTVYLAERADGAFQQRVAVKLLRRGLDTEEILTRFRAERQILASLNHPHIARLLDGGAAPDGRPYLVMELVEGLPITEHCDRHRLGVGERLRLFATVGRAVQYAHRNLVVHRDLKPSNILVAADGTVKLLDFGIAKLLDDAAHPGTTPFTRTGLRLMTPEYASPEQVQGEAVTTASDVYQLGVLLYELLAGQRPYELRRRSPGEAERVILTQEPLPPSALATRQREAEVKGLHATPPDWLARWRGSDVRRLRSRLRGDLDTIALMALRKEPERRYASVAELVEDVERHLEGRPVSARPDTWGYRARKFTTRNPGAVVVTVLGILALGGYMGTLQAHAERLEGERNNAQVERGRAEAAQFLAEGERTRAMSERDNAAEAQRLAETERVRAEDEGERAETERRRAEEALQRARVETAKATQVTAFLANLFEESDPAQSQGEKLTVREVLDRGLAEADRLPPDPEVRAELLAVMSRVYGSLGLYDPALSLAEQALGLRRERFGNQHPAVAQSLFEVGSTLWQVKDLDRAEHAFREALRIQQQLLGSEHPDAARSRSSLGLVRWHQLDLDGAEQLLRHALDSQQKSLGDDHLDVARTLYHLGVVRQEKRDFGESQQLLRQAITLKRRLLGDSHPDVAEALHRLGITLYAAQDFDGSEETHREALAMRRKIFGEEHPAVASSLGGIGMSLARDGSGDLERASRYYEQALAMQSKLLGDHLDLAMTHYGFAWLLGRKGDHAGSVQHNRAALEIRRRLLGNEHPVLIASLVNLGNAMTANGDLDEAEQIHREALALRRKRSGYESADVAMSLTNLAFVRRAKGDLGRAVELTRESLAIYRKVHGLEHPSIALTMSNLGMFLGMQGNYVEGEIMLREALTMRRGLLGEHHPNTRLTRQRLHELLARRERIPVSSHPD